MKLKNKFVTTLIAVSLGGCVTTSMQGYADRDLPVSRVANIAAFVNGPQPLSQALQTSLADEAQRRGVTLEDARTIFPPTRQYSDAETKQDLKARGVDGVLVVDVADSGIQREYLGTVFNSNYSGTGTVTTFGNMSTISYGGASNGFSAPIVARSRQTSFKARLTEPSSGRNLWVGEGQVNAGGLLFVGNGTSASQAAAAIFNDFQSKGLIAAH